MKLDIVFELNQRLAGLQSRVIQYRQMAEDAKTTNWQQQIRGTSQTSRTEWVATLIVDNEKKLSDTLKEKEEAIRKLTLKFDSADVPEVVRTIFFLRYVNCEQWKKIARVVGYSETRCYQLHDQWKGKMAE